MQAYSAASTRARYSGGARWVMDLAWYQRVRAASEIGCDQRTNPDLMTPHPGDTLFGIRISVRDGGGEPHLEMTDGDPRDPRDVAMALAREALALPALDRLPADTMLAVAPVPGKILEEWRHADLGVWIAWPHAAEAACAEEMTAAQLRAILAARDGGHG